MYTTEKLKEMLALELKKSGNVYTDRRKTLEEMIKMRENSKK